MRKYWIRIALTALGIFFVGMMIVSAGRRGVDRVKELAMHHTLRLTSGGAPFQVDTRRLGTLTEVQIDPDRSEKFPFINMTVELDPGLPMAGLDSCTLLASDMESLKSDRGLHCAEGISRDSVVQMGEVNFEPSGESVGIFIPAREVEDIPWFNNFRRDQPVRNSAAGLSLSANAAGAFMLIKDDKGRPVFQLNADSSGAFIQIRDSNGKEVVRFRADSNGVQGQARSN
jgi:hypothetical protein